MNKLTVRITVGDKQHEHYDLSPEDFIKLLQKHIDKGDFAFEGYDCPVENATRRKDYVGHNDIAYSLKKTIDRRLHEYHAFKLPENLYKLASALWNNQFEESVAIKHFLRPLLNEQFLAVFQADIYEMHSKEYPQYVEYRR